MSTILEGELTTKQDLKITEQAIRSDMKTMEAGLRTDMKIMEANLRTDMQVMQSKLEKGQMALNDRFNSLENRLTIKMGALFIIALSTFITLLKFWIIR